MHDVAHERSVLLIVDNDVQISVLRRASIILVLTLSAVAAPDGGMGPVLLTLLLSKQV